MRRTLLLLVSALLASAAVIALQRLDDQWQYRQRLAEGDRHMREGETYLAVEAYSGALALRSESMVGYYRRGEAYAAQGQTQQALRDLHRARALAPSAPEPLEALGRLHDRNGDHYSAALWFSDAAARLQDSDARLLYSLALAQYRIGALARAHDAVRRAVSRDPLLTAAHYLQGLVARDLGQTREAVAALEQAIRLDNTFVEARRALASVQTGLGRHTHAAAELARLPDNTGNIAARVAAALSRLRAGDIGGALADLTPITPAQAADARVALALGHVSLARAEQTGDRADVRAALETLEQALGASVARSEGLALYGRALHLDGRLPEAERLLREAVRTTPVHAGAFAYLADVEEALEHPGAARDALAALTAFDGSGLSPATLRARYRRMGELSLRARDAQAALVLLGRAATVGAPLHTELAEAHWLAGQRARAEVLLAAARQRTPGDPAIARLERLFR